MGLAPTIQHRLPWPHKVWRTTDEDAAHPPRRSRSRGIACDSRHQSQELQIAAEVLAASGLEPVVLMRPTPQLSWTVRELGAVAGVVVTASRNPSIYNGYKVYAADGGQVVAPEDAQLVAEVRALSTDQPVAEQDGIHVLDATWDDRYRDVGLVPVVAVGGERVVDIAYRLAARGRSPCQQP